MFRVEFSIPEVMTRRICSNQCLLLMPRAPQERTLLYARAGVSKFSFLSDHRLAMHVLPTRTRAQPEVSYLHPDPVLPTKMTRGER